MKTAHLFVGLLVISVFISCKKLGGDGMSNVVPTPFEKYYGGDEDDMGNSAVIQNGEMYVYGTTKSFGDLYGDHYLVKMDLAGTVIFEKTYGGSDAEEGQKIIATSDGNFLLLGTTKSSGGGQKDIHLIKINNNGDALWEKTYGGITEDFPSSMIEKANGDFCIAATTESFGAGGRDIYVLWVSPTGDLIQQKYFGGALNDGGSDLIEIENNDIMLYAYTNSFGASGQDYYLMRLNEVGDTLWTKQYGGNDYEESQGFARTTNGDFVMNGHSSSTDPLHNMLTVKVDENGTQIWEKEFGGVMHDGGTTMLINAQGNYVLLARSVSFGNGDRNIYMVTTDPNGNKISDDVIGGKNSDWAMDILEEGAFYYIIGNSNSKNVSNSDVYVVKYKK